MPSCFVKGCKSQWKKTAEDLSMHIFPRDAERIKTWLRILQIKEDQVEDLTARILADRKGAFRICSRHFSNRSYELRGTMTFLRRDAVPSLNLDDQDDSPEHSYAKRMRLVETASSDPSQASLQQTIKEENSQLVQQFTVQTYDALEGTTDMSAFPDAQAAEPLLIPGCEIEVVYETETTASPQNLELTEPRTYKRKPMRHTRSFGTSTHNNPEYRHKSSQFDGKKDVKNKKSWARRFPPHRSIGIQCELMVDTPSRPYSEEITILYSPERRNDSDDGMTDQSDSETCCSDEGNNRVDEPMESQDGNLPCPGLTPVYPKASYKPFVKPGGSNSLQDSMEELGLMDESFRLFNEEKTDCREESERNNANPRDLDSSAVYMAPTLSRGNYIEENKFIVFESCLDQLLFSAACKGSKECDGKIESIKKYRIGSAISVSARCTNGHNFHLWRSQPLIAGMPVGNILISAAILCSGLHFLKIDSFFRFLGVFSIGQTTHHSNQTSFLFPAINYHWQVERLKTLESVRNHPLVLAGDSQFDSRSHRARYCTYSFMEHNSKKIIDFQVEPLDSGISPVNLLKQSFQLTLDRLRSEEVDIKVLCTERHDGIRKLLRKSYGDIIHQLDVWHLARSVENELLVASRRSACGDLAGWASPAKNHLWWAARTCGRNPQLLRELWSSIIYHATDKHQWEDGELYKKCYHSNLTSAERNSREWLIPGSVSHCKLKEIVLNNKLLKDLEHHSQFCPTGEIEVFHRTASKYRSKSIHYTIDSMVARTQLAALDYNFNVHRLQPVAQRLMSCEREEDLERHSFRYSKPKTKWIAERIYEPSNQSFIKVILLDILELVAGNRQYLWSSRKPNIDQSLVLCSPDKVVPLHKKPARFPS
ncbi:uncharacterized protein [Hyperolius riggenbachi]|uniref:uncharacterized protein n=1 Tax=Hyperolius riggenbachi TaxID=752182 RepID=UPI0035A29554